MKSPNDGGPVLVMGNATMSLRDWFAGMAMLGLLASGPGTQCGTADLAYRFADAMLAEREGGGK